MLQKGIGESAQSSEQFHIHPRSRSSSIPGMHFIGGETHWSLTVPPFDHNTYPLGVSNGECKANITLEKLMVVPLDDHGIKILRVVYILYDLPRRHALLNLNEVTGDFSP